MVIRKKKKKNNFVGPEVRINSQIWDDEVRVLDAEGANLGLMKTKDALKQAQSLNLDLVEVSNKNKPALVKIIDYGKFLYDKKKKDKDIKAKTVVTETKTVQVKPGTGEGDLALKARNISKWLEDGDKVKLDLFLRGRAKYMDKDFLEERLKRVLLLVTANYKISDKPKKSPKGLTIVLELDKRKK